MSLTKIANREETDLARLDEEASTALARGLFVCAKKVFHRLWSQTRNPIYLAKLGEALYRGKRPRRARAVLEASFALKPQVYTGAVLMQVLNALKDFKAERKIWEYCLRNLGSQLPAEPW